MAIDRILAHLVDTPVDEIIGAFIGQFYEDKKPPAEIFLAIYLET